MKRTHPNELPLVDGNRASLELLALDVPSKAHRLALAAQVARQRGEPEITLTAVRIATGVAAE